MIWAYIDPPCGTLDKYLPDPALELSTYLDDRSLSWTFFWESLRVFVMSSTAASAAATATSAPKAPPQGGVLEGVSPVKVDPKNPIILFIIQVAYPQTM